MDANKKTPCIIAVFSVISKAAKYYIQVKDRLLCVCFVFDKAEFARNIYLPLCFFHMQLPDVTFIEVIDFFIKVHNVFNLPYSKEIAKVMQFLEYLVYDMLTSKRFMTDKMVEVAKTMIEMLPEPDVDGA